jgi:hypothetical protein
VLLFSVTKTTIQAELPPELTARALTFVKEGWGSERWLRP